MAEILWNGLDATLTVEQQARNLLERLDVPDAQTYSTGEVIELANLIAEVSRLRRALGEAEGREQAIREQLRWALQFAPTPFTQE